MQADEDTWQSSLARKLCCPKGIRTESGQRRGASPVEPALGPAMHAICGTGLIVGICNNGAEAVQLRLAVEQAAELVNHRHKPVAGLPIAWAEACTPLDMVSNAIDDVCTVAVSVKQIAGMPECCSHVLQCIIIHINCTAYEYGIQVRRHSTEWFCLWQGHSASLHFFCAKW